jgi:hypothetical protein
MCGMIGLRAIISGANPISDEEAAGGRDVTPRREPARSRVPAKSERTKFGNQKARSGAFRAGSMVAMMKIYT